MKNNNRTQTREYRERMKARGTKAHETIEIDPEYLAEIEREAFEDMTAEDIEEAEAADQYFVRSDARASSYRDEV